MIWGLPQYRVWQRGLSGQAQLREAEEERAKGSAEAMKVIQKKLTAEYLRYLAIQAQKKMADSPNHTTVYIPSGELGVPLIRELE